MIQHGLFRLLIGPGGRQAIKIVAGSAAIGLLLGMAHEIFLQRILNKTGDRLTDEDEPVGDVIDLEPHEFRRESERT